MYVCITQKSTLVHRSSPHYVDYIVGGSADEDLRVSMWFLVARSHASFGIDLALSPPAIVPRRYQ